jgi:hypothetical protein
MGARTVVWAMAGECPLPIPRRPGGALAGRQSLLRWLGEVRAHCLASGAFLTALGAASWAGLWTPEYEQVLGLFEEADRKAGLDY